MTVRYSAWLQLVKILTTNNVVYTAIFMYVNSMSEWMKDEYIKCKCCMYGVGNLILGKFGHLCVMFTFYAMLIVLHGFQIWTVYQYLFMKPTHGSQICSYLIIYNYMNQIKLHMTSPVSFIVEALYKVCTLIMCGLELASSKWRVI